MTTSKRLRQLAGLTGLDGFADELRAMADELDAAAPTVQEPVAQAWDEGYRAGIDDERTSEASIGIAGFGAKVEPARNNPYRTTTPAAQQVPRKWVGLTDKQMVDAIEPLYLNRSISEMAAEVSMADFRAIEAKLKDKNNG
jgi:hypothetical protein